jgi:hypothetical protein
MVVPAGTLVLKEILEIMEQTEPTEKTEKMA